MFVFSIGTGVITARSLGASGRGLLGALLTWPQFIAYLATFGLCASLLLNAKRRPEERGRLYAAALVLASVFGLLAALAGIALMPELMSHYSTAEMWQARLVMLAAPIILLALVLQTGAEGVGDFSGANLFRILGGFGTFATIIALAVTHLLTPLAAAACYLLPQALVAVWLFRRSRLQYRPELHGFLRASRQLCTLGLRCYPIELVNAANGYLGQVMVASMLAPEAVGFFIVSLGIARLLEIFYAAIAAILLPVTAAQSKADVINKTARAARVTFMAMACAAMPLIIAMGYVLPLVYGVSFDDAVPIARTLLLESLLGGTIWILMQAFVALGRPELATTIHVAVIGISAPLLIGLVPRLGPLGAAQILLSMSLLKLALVLLVYRLVLAVSPVHFVPRVSDVRHVKAALAR
jgi:O-antigen/teichoic acid export membrane protein